MCLTLLAVLLLHGCGKQPDGEKPEGMYSNADLRIVSLSPNITEILFELDLGAQVVGVTRFCNFPKAAGEKDKIGGYYDVNYEAILSVHPDLVILLKHHVDAIAKLEALDINILVVDNSSIEAIYESITEIGAACGRKSEADGLLVRLRNEVNLLRKKTKSSVKKKVLIVVGHQNGLDNVDGLYVSGNDGFFDLLLQWAGAENVFSHSSIKFPLVTREAIIELNPDLVIELAADPSLTDADIHNIQEGWQSLSMVTAVQEKQIYILTEDYAVIPGPRFVQLLREFVKICHPEEQLLQ